jgi:hypothetical protein
VSELGPHDPTAQDEDEAIRLLQLVGTVGLTSLQATDDGPRADCGSCRHYLNPGDPLAYCWHPNLRMLVDAGWSCRHHDRAPEEP